MRITAFSRFLAVGTTIWLASAPLQAQESLAGVGAAASAGAALGAAAGGAAMSAGNAAKRGAEGGNPAMPNEAGNPGGAAGGTTTTTTTTVTTRGPIYWGNNDADSILNQLLAAKTPTRPIPTRKARTPKNRAQYSAKVAKMTPAQRKKLVLQKYQIPPRAWLAHYLPDDRYKLNSNVWKFVSTETDRFYYKPDAPGMLRQSPHRVIGFHSWQDAMIAGYRPDPITKPEPGAQFAYLARIGRGPQLRTFVEYAYSGQVTPQNFAATFNYIQQVAKKINAVSYARPFLPETVEKIIEASLTGNPSLIPRTIGGTPQPVKVSTGSDLAGANVTANANNGGGTAAAPPDAQAQGAPGKREDEFDNFKNRAGSLAKTPGNR